MNPLQSPLSERMRPKSLAEYVGQQQILGDQSLLRNLLAGDLKILPSLILWGPPGSGKTTLARLIAQQLDVHFEPFSATSSGVKEARKLMEEAQERLQGLLPQRTLFFIDEIHRFNKSQQDILLPFVEDGSISLIGATTENPSFELNAALLSRMRVYVLEALSPEDLLLLLQRALKDPRGLSDYDISIEEGALETLCQLSHGDARIALNALEFASSPAKPQTPFFLSQRQILDALQKNSILYDKTGEEHFNLMSALHKSIRHSDPNAALYYLARMIEGGEDALYLARRLVRAASEDIGLADPQALAITLHAKEAVEFLGYPECDAALAQAVVYLSTAPKSNSVYKAIQAAKGEVRNSGPLAVPLHYRNAPTSLMKDLGYAKGYAYDHDAPQGVSKQDPFPEKLKKRRFLELKEIGFEKEIIKRLQYFERLKSE